MISTVFNAQTVFVLNDEWNGRSDFTLDVSLVRDDQASLTKREGRRPYAETLLCRAQYAVTIKGAALRTFQASMRALTTETVVLPLWPAIQRWADRAAAPIGGGLMIVWKSDWSQYAIYSQDDAEPGWPDDDDNWAPALMGLLSPSMPDFMTPGAASWNIDFTESSPPTYALQPADIALTAGPVPAGYGAGPPIFPFDPDFKKISEGIGVDVDRSQAGFSRQTNQTFYPQTAARSQTAGFTLKGDEVGQMLRFIQDVAGPGLSFWTPGWFECARLSDDVDAADIVLHVEDSSAVNVGDYILLGSLARKIDAKGSGTITIDAAPGVDLAASSTLLLPLCLARLGKGSITFAWRAPGLAKFQMPWIEQPAEVAIAADEALAGTIGGLPTKVILFYFYRDLGNGTVLNWYYTNYERDLEWNGQVWTSQPGLAHGEIIRSLNLEKDGVTISSFKFEGNPLLDDVLLLAEAPLNVRIYHAELQVTAPIAGEGGGHILDEGGVAIHAE